MSPFGSLGVGLGFLFVMGGAAGLYYMLQSKKMLEEKDMETGGAGNLLRETIFLLPCLTKPRKLFSKTSKTRMNSQRNGSEEDDKRDDDDDDEEREESDSSKLHELCHPPRFLFTIKEETDLEYEDSVSRRSSGDIGFSPETLYLTPLSSPLFFTPPLTPLMETFTCQGFNPLYESSMASPPPKLKFLKDAEEKLYRKTRIEARGAQRDAEDGEGPLASIFPGKKGEWRQQYLQQLSNSSLSNS